MIRREGRVENPTSTSRAGGRKGMVIRDWERPIFVAALIAILVLGGIAGLNSLMSLIP